MKIPKYLKDCPIIDDWCVVNDEVFYGMINVERSLKAKRAMIDLSYCATKALNGIVIKTVKYNPETMKIHFVTSSKIH